MNDYNKLKQELEIYEVLFEPLIVLPTLVKTTQDIFKFKSVLKSLPCTDEIVTYLANIILEAISAQKRFRKVECLKVLRSIVRNSQGVPHFESTTIRLLFRIYQNLIFDLPEDGQWAVSVLIKGQLLENSEIHWLINNYKQSVHPLNRLLLYPEYHPTIAEWAERVYLAHEFPEREIEIISLCIQKNLPPFVDQGNYEVILKSISRARLTLAEKEILLIKMAHPENIHILMEIAINYKMKTLFQIVKREVTAKISI